MPFLFDAVIIAGKQKKLRKLAGKLSMKKNRSVDYKAEQERNVGVLEYHPLLQPLANGE